MILCVGALGAGKSTLLRVLQQFGQEYDADQEPAGAGSAVAAAPVPAPITTPTMGTDLLTIIKSDKWVESHMNFRIVSFWGKKVERHIFFFFTK